MGLLAVALGFACGSAKAQPVKWESLGRKDDYEMFWASNLKSKTEGGIMTMLRLKYDREDAAPNNARFDNERIGVHIRCNEMTYDFMGQSYNMGEREVFNQTFPPSPYKPVAGTIVAKFADRACGR